MESSIETPLASVSDGNLVEKFVDWRRSFMSRMKEYQFYRSVAGKKCIEKVNSLTKDVLQKDAKTGLNAQSKELVVKTMHLFETKLSENIAKRTEIKDGEVNENPKEPEDSPDVASNDKENQESASNVKSELVCDRCGYLCANYKRCPALDKQCRKCGSFDHYEKFCKKPALASVSDGNLVEKWIHWKQSFLCRMRMHEFDRSPKGKSMIEKVNSFERDILRTDRKVGLNAERRKEVVNLMHKMEFDLCSSVAVIERRKKKEQGESEATTSSVNTYENSDASNDVEEASETEVTCLQCGLVCAKYQQCPALGKECRRCLRRDHYAKMCKSKISTAKNEYVYDRDEVESADPPKKPTLASVRDGNLVEKFVNWKNSFRVRMREHNFEGTLGGKQVLDRIGSFGREIFREDKKYGLKYPRKKVVVRMMRRYEKNLTENIARIEGGNSEEPEDVDEQKTEKPIFKFMCDRCGFYCGNYKWCPADGKQCRRCRRHGHYERMCKWQRSRYERKVMFEERRKHLMFRRDPLFGDSVSDNEDLENAMDDLMEAVEKIVMEGNIDDLGDPAFDDEEDLEIDSDDEEALEIDYDDEEDLEIDYDDE